MDSPENNKAVEPSEKSGESLDASLQNSSKVEEKLADIFVQYAGDEEKIKQEVIGIFTKVTTIRMWEGPMPSPESLAKYGELINYAPERLLKSFEKEQEHRHSMNVMVTKSEIETRDKVIEHESGQVKHENKMQMMGLIMAFALAVVLFGLTAFLAIKEQPGFAASSFVIGAGAIVGPFIYYWRRSEKTKKEQ